jgi:CubicO group peptidase (beta-lactamase class C family)
VALGGPLITAMQRLVARHENSYSADHYFIGMSGPFTLLAVLATAPTIALGQGAQPNATDTVTVAGAVGQAIDAKLTEYNRLGFSGTVLVARDGRIVLLKGYGLANKEGGVPNATDTRFEMNSMTKMLTGVSLLQLAAAGKLAIDDRIEVLLGPFPEPKRSATIRHLALHTAGLVPAGTQLPGPTRDEFIASVKRVPLESPPGASYRYTNAGYSVLAAIIEKASGQTYEEYLRAHIFAPAGMTTAIFLSEVSAQDRRFARGYPTQPYQYGWGITGAGGVWCTVGDMYRYLLAVESGALVPAQFMEFLHSPPAPPSVESFGWHVYARTDSSRARIDKGGGSNDFASQLLYFPDDRVAVIWVSNDLTKRWRQTLNRAIPDIVFTGTTKAALP